MAKKVEWPRWHVQVGQWKGIPLEPRFGTWRGLFATAFIPCECLPQLVELFKIIPFLEVTLMRDSVIVGSVRCDMYNADMVSRRSRRDMVPGCVFPHLANTNIPCELDGPVARFYWFTWPRDAVSRAVVNFGRQEAGLPPIDWEEHDRRAEASPPIRRRRRTR
jgi:hypothetical protein